MHIRVHEDLAFEDIIAKLGETIRGKLRDIEDLSSFHFTVHIEGPVHNESGLKITYQAAKYDHFGAEKTEGDTVTAVVTEFMRRYGWTQRHGPKMLEGPASLPEGADVTSELDDENPF